jgi:hypothetical protein
MAQSISEKDANPLPQYAETERFRRYAQGRITYLWKRQFLTAIGAVYLALMISPMVGLLAGVLALSGEIVDCINLRFQLKALKQGRPLRTAGIAASATATLQAISIAACILIAWFLPSTGNGMHFALVFLMSASLNAGLVWPYHKPSACARLLVYGLAFLGAAVQHQLSWDGGKNVYLSEVISMLLMCYIVAIVLQFVVGNHARQMRSAEQIIAASKALKTSRGFNSPVQHAGYLL